MINARLGMPAESWTVATREDIAAIIVDVAGDKPGRISRLRAQRLLDQIKNNLPFTWQQRANVSVVIKEALLRGNAIEFVIDLTIRGETKSLSAWVEGKYSPPDWCIINPPLFVVDPAGDVTLQDGRRGRDDFVVAMRQVFTDTFGAKIADLVRTTAR